MVRSRCNRAILSRLELSRDEHRGVEHSRLRLAVKQFSLRLFLRQSWMLGDELLPLLFGNHGLIHVAAFELGHG